MRRSGVRVPSPAWAAVQAEPAQLALEVGPGLALTAALGDRVAERQKRALDDLGAGPEATLLALAQPRRGRGVAARAVAGSARRDLVLRPRRAALQARDDMLERERAVP